MTAYFYIAKMKILTSLAYRFEVFSSLSVNTILMIASFFIWKTAYKGIDSVAGVSESGMITYSLVSIMLSTIFTCSVQDTMSSRVRQGSVAVDLIKPVNILISYLAEDMGSSISSAVNKLLPMILLAILFFKVPLPADHTSALIFIPSCMFSYFILWLFSALTGLLSFWIMNLGNIGYLKDSIVGLMSGAVVPLWLLPERLEAVVEFLPFKYTYQTPLSIYIGRLAPSEALPELGIQLAWIAVLTVLLYIMWSRARKAVLLQGG